MAQFPSLSSDGARLLFDWKNDIWIANSKGGRARRLTQTEGRDTRAMFSPDGKTLAFTSNRDGSYQVYLMPVSGGVARQVTFHSEGSFAVDWYPDGKSILVRGIRDHAGRYAYRFFRVLIDAGKDEAEGQELREAPSLLFDATGSDASLSPDGKRLLFTREGMDTYRKGYEGSRASQIWLADGLEGKNPSYRRISPLELKSGARKPQWSADGMAFFYLGAHGKNGVFEVRISELREDGKMSADVEWTDSEGEFPVTHQRLSRDGSTLVYQRGFEIYRLDVSDAAEVEPKRINLWVGDDSANDPRDLEMRRVLKKATNLSFSSDGLEVAFIAGGDLWVMDTVLREPRRITSTPEEEGEPIFAPDNNSIFYIGDAGRSADVWRAERANAKAYWWLNDSFRHTKLTDDGEQKRDLHLVPGGKKIAYVRGLGDLWTAQYDGSKPEKVIESWSMPSVSWSPDGRWLAYAIDDDDFNRDIWIKPADGSQEPFNLSRHPDYDSNPAWSPDGKILAFTGRRVEDETDIYYVWLTREGEQQGKRDRTLRQAVEKMKKERKPAPGTPASSADPAKAEGAKAGGGDAAKPAVEKKNEEAKPESKGADEPKKAGDEKETPAKAAKPEVKIDFEGIYERIHRIKIANSDEAGLFWAPDSKRLAFRGEVKASKGTFMVTFPDKLTTPVALTSKIGSFARWTTNNDTILWMVDGLPATFSKGKSVMYPITALQTLNRQEYRREAFEQVWRTMRDRYYDESLNHLDWDGVYQRYVDMAATAPTDRTFDDVVEMLLGELNGSHMGFSLSSLSSPSSGPWKNETAHLGMQFDRFYQGEGWKISSVFTNGPADKTGMNLEPGDVITRVDGKEVNPLVDPAAVLNGRLDRDVALTVVDQVVAEDKAPAAAEGGAAEKPIERRIRLRPITYSSARQLGNQDHLKATRESVEKLSGGKLGYVYVPRMQWDEFVKFEEEIYARGAGREGLIIDVRDNGGGFTADHLLTVLTPPRHAFTVGRGGGRGYPQDRRVYAAWTKPIVVLCNQNSFSNAEIFAHAIQTLGRGKLVGEITAGGVISTGSTRIMDYGVLRLPGRGWFKIDDGEDMELNGAVPDVIVRNLPGEVPAGIDRQMERAVKVLLNDVDAAARKPSVDATPASDR